MSGWNTTMLGVKVNSADETLAKQFLVCLGVDFDGYMAEEVGMLDFGNFRPSIDGTIEHDEYGIASIIEKHSEKYISGCYGYGEEEDWEDDDEDWEDDDEDNDEDDGEDWEDDDEDSDEDDDEDWEDDDEDEDNVISGLFYLMNQLFSPTYLYIAHEEGNDTSDCYYRYESIYDPVAGKKTESECYYSYGDGINIEDDNPRTSATEKKEGSILPTVLSSRVIELLIKEAESHQFDELAEKIKATPHR